MITLAGMLHDYIELGGLPLPTAELFRSQGKQPARAAPAHIFNTEPPIESPGRGEGGDISCVFKELQRPR